MDLLILQEGVVYQHKAACSQETQGATEYRAAIVQVKVK